jgi:hypothetical protein
LDGLDASVGLSDFGKKGYQILAKKFIRFGERNVELEGEMSFEKKALM